MEENKIDIAVLTCIVLSGLYLIILLLMAFGQVITVKGKWFSIEFTSINKSKKKKKNYFS